MPYLAVPRPLRGLTTAALLAIAAPLPVSAAATLYTDPVAFQAALDSTSDELEVLVTDAAGVGQAEETGPPNPNTNVGSTLTFLRENTGLSRSLQIVGTPQITFDDDEGGTNPYLDFDNALSIGDVNGLGSADPTYENDDWSLTVTGGAPMRAFGFTLRNNNGTAGETLTLYDERNIVLAVVPLDSVPNGNPFVGVIADFEFARVAFDEDPGGDDIAIADFTFQVASTVSLERITPTDADGRSDLDYAAISANGEHVLFTSTARNLTWQSQGGRSKVVYRDRTGDGMRLRSSDRASAGDVSDNGDNIVYTRLSDGEIVFDRDGERTVLATSSAPASNEGDDRRNPRPRMDSTGRHVVFEDLLADGGIRITLIDTETLTTEAIDVTVDGGAPDGPSYRPDISEDGRYVVFISYASNLVRDDTNGLPDVFVRDRQQGETWRVNLTPQGRQTMDTVDGGARYYNPSISLDGRYVAFWSGSRELVNEELDLGWHLFLRDQASGETRYIATTRREIANGNTPTISAGGRYVAFAAVDTGLVSDAVNRNQAFVYDTVRDELTMVSRNPRYGEPGNADTSFAYISADGRSVMFASRASNLGEVDRNRVADVFVAPLIPSGDPGFFPTETLEAQGVGEQGITLSTDGRYVAYVRGDPKEVVVRDLQTGWETIESLDETGQPFVDVREPELAADARRIGLTGLKEGGTAQVYVRFRDAGGIRLASKGPTGEPGDDISEEPRLCADPDLVAYVSNATNLGPTGATGWQVYVHDFSTGLNTRVSETAAGVPADIGVERRTIGISEDCRYVVFQSGAKNLTSAPVEDERQQIYLKDRSTGTLTLVSKDATGAPLTRTAHLGELPISADGRYVVFTTGSTALGPTGLYRYDRLTDRVTRLGDAGTGSENVTTMSRNGRYVLFEDQADRLQRLDTLDGTLVYVGRSANGNLLDTDQYVVNNAGDVVFLHAGALLLRDGSLTPWRRPETCDDCSQGSLLLRLLPALIERQ